MSKNKIYIILGGGITDNGKIPDHVLSRLDIASSLCQKNDLIITSSSFSLNIPPKMDKNNFILFESTEMAKELYKRGFRNLITENWSHDTIGSALFCRMLIESIDTDKNSITVITSDFHFERASNIFKWAFNILEPIFKPIEMIETHTPNLSEEDVTKRSIKEKSSNESFERNFKIVTEFNEALKKLLIEHDNYNIRHMSKNRNIKNLSLY